MPRGAAGITLSPVEEAELRRLERLRSSPQQTAMRARVVLRCADGATNRGIAREVGMSELAVGRWRARFACDGIAGLADKPRSGRPRTVDEATVNRVIAKTLESPEAESQWSTRALARETGLSHQTVHRIWRQHRLKPHRARTFEYSTDPELEAKVIDIVGLYLDPPRGALVLCVDENTQIQALDRTQPILPIRPGLPEGRTHDYKRHGTTSLYAALEIASGQVTSECHPRHRAAEFLAFMRRIVREHPSGELHIVLDNSSTHTTPEVKRWLARHRRVRFHFTPTGASWMNMVESWFSILTRKQIRRGTYASVPELIAAIERFVTGYNQHAQPFAWTKNAQQILAKAIKPNSTSVTEH